MSIDLFLFFHLIIYRFLYIIKGSFFLLLSPPPPPSVQKYVNCCDDKLLLFITRRYILIILCLGYLFSYIYIFKSHIIIMRKILFLLLIDVCQKMHWREIMGIFCCKRERVRFTHRSPPTTRRESDGEIHAPKHKS